MSEQNPEYEELLVGKKGKTDPSKNPNYRRLEGLSNLVKRLKYEKGRVDTIMVQSEEIDSHVIAFKKENYKKSFDSVIEWYDTYVIPPVKKELEEWIKSRTN